MKKQNTCDFADILSHAETLGYKWNKAHNILDNYTPAYGPRTVYLEEVEEEENEDAKKILLSYFKVSQVEEFVILPKVC